MLSPLLYLLKNKKKKTYTFGRQPAVVLTWDDGYETDYSVAYSLMSARGMTGTSYVNTSTVGASNKLSWAQITEMVNTGWDVQCHTHEHINLMTATEQEIINNLTAVNNAFTTNGLPSPKHIAYPFGAINGSAISIISQYRDSGRITANNEIVPFYADKYMLNCYTAEPRTLEDITKIEEGLQLAIAQEREVMFYLHEIKEGAVQYQTETARFIDMLDLINYYELETITISELYNRI